MKGRILIAGHDNQCRARLLELLSKRPLTIHSICDEADLLLEVLDRDYDVIIFDMEASRLDGLKMIKVLRKIRPKVSLVAVSNDPSTDLGGRIWHEGVAYYAVKPLNYEAIQAAVFNAIGAN